MHRTEQVQNALYKRQFLCVLARTFIIAQDVEKVKPSPGVEPDRLVYRASPAPRVEGHFTGVDSNDLGLVEHLPALD